MSGRVFIVRTVGQPSIDEILDGAPLENIERDTIIHIDEPGCPGITKITDNSVHFNEVRVVVSHGARVDRILGATRRLLSGTLSRGDCQLQLRTL